MLGQAYFTRRSLVFRTIAAALACAVTLAAVPAWSQGKITRFVVAFPPGGPVDFVARVIGDQLGQELHANAA